MSMIKNSKETLRAFFKFTCIIVFILTVLQSCSKDGTKVPSEKEQVRANVKGAFTTDSFGNCYQNGPVITITDASGTRTIEPRVRIECYMVESNWTPEKFSLKLPPKATGEKPNVPSLPPAIVLDVVRNVNIEISNACLNNKVQNIFAYTPITFTITNIIRRIIGNPYRFVTIDLKDGVLQNGYALTTSSFDETQFPTPTETYTSTILNKETLPGASQSFIAAAILYETIYGCFPDGWGTGAMTYMGGPLKSLTKQELTDTYIKLVVDYLSTDYSAPMQKEDALALAWYFLRTTDAYNSSSPFVYTYKSANGEEHEISLSKSQIESRNASLLAGFSATGCN